MVPGSVRCTPSTRMSRTTNGSTAHAAHDSADATRLATSADTATRARLIRGRSEQAGNIIEECKGHQDSEHRHAYALTDLECSVGYGTAFDKFGEIIQ